jgi:hypothetical protein
MSMESYYQVENSARQRINEYQREAEKEAVIKEARSSEPHSIRQAIGNMIISIGSKIAQVPESQQA